jgi:hypothetical protein
MYGYLESPHFRLVMRRGCVIREASREKPGTGTQGLPISLAIISPIPLQ